MERMAEPPMEVHGGVDLRELAELGIDASEVLDLSVNVNPRGPSTAVLRAIAHASITSYPDRTSQRAREAIGNALDCDPARVMLGHGSVELLWAIVSELRRSGNAQPLLIVGPTFAEPAAAARAHGIRCVHVDMKADDEFALDVTRIDDAIDECYPCAVYLCQPNNPTGRALSGSELQALVARHPETRFVLDQAFLSLSTEHAQLGIRFERAPNVIVVRSLTKDHALAGLRAGYALASPDWLARIEAQRPPWMVSGPAQAAAIAAMQQSDYVKETREQLVAAREQLSAAIAQLGFSVVPSTTHFVLVRVSDADRVREQLLRDRRVLVRSCRSFGLPGHIRIAAGDTDATARLLEGLAELER
jgi:histidinol-phosphate aminotransferase